MPVITIIVSNMENKLDLKKIAEDVSVKSGFEIGRINVIAEYYKQEDFYKGSEDNYPIIHVSVIERNGKELIQRLMEASAYAVKAQTGFDETLITVYSHPIKDGCILKNGKFN